MDGRTTTVDNSLDEAAANAVHANDSGATFIITRPGTMRSRVFGDESSLRGAIAVAVAAGSDRRWVGLAHGVHRIRVIDLPAVIREVAERQSSWTVRVGVVRHRNNAAAVVLWFGALYDDASTVDSRDCLLGLLTTAAAAE